MSVQKKTVSDKININISSQVNTELFFSRTVNLKRSFYKLSFMHHFDIKFIKHPFWLYEVRSTKYEVRSTKYEVRS
jgi:hypothetical protein